MCNVNLLIYVKQLTRADVQKNIFSKLFDKNWLFTVHSQLSLMSFHHWICIKIHHPHNIPFKHTMATPSMYKERLQHIMHCKRVNSQIAEKH